jgi:hypothetical protein
MIPTEQAMAPVCPREAGNWLGVALGIASPNGTPDTKQISFQPIANK